MTTNINNHMKSRAVETEPKQFCWMVGAGVWAKSFVCRSRSKS